MNVLLYGRYGEYPAEIEEKVRAAGLTIVAKNPDVVLSFGGDGTLLGAERDFPAVPKLPLRDSKICHICSPLPNEKLLELLVAGKLRSEKLMKLEAKTAGKTLVALNDIVIRSQLPNLALRFDVTVNGEPVSEEELIGDGVVVSTPFGSTGYFYSITRKIFNSGLGLAFNNVHNAILDQRVLDPESTISVTVKRGPALLAADNNPEIIALADGEKVDLIKAEGTATIFIP